MTQYYLSGGQQPRGPFPLTELRAQGLTASSLVWHKQLSDWLPVTAVPEVQALLPKLPPALPKTPPALPKVPSQVLGSQKQVLPSREPPPQGLLDQRSE